MTYDKYVWNVAHGNNVPYLLQVDRPYLAKMCVEAADKAEKDVRAFGPLANRKECIARLRAHAEYLQRVF